MSDHTAMRLGKGPAKLDARRLKLAHYAIGLPEPPEQIDFMDRWVGDIGMLANDFYGDCTIASVGHATQALGLYLPSDEVVLNYYSRWCGYVPGDPSTDQGGIEVDVLNQWRKEGFNGHKLLAYADPPIANTKIIRQAIAALGGLYIGLSLPVSAQEQDVWDVVQGPDAEPGSWGGHAVYAHGFNPTGPFCITWGERKQMTWAFWLKYTDEAHALFLEDYIGEHGPAEGIDQDALLADLKLITG